MLTLRQALGQATSTEGAPALQDPPGARRPMRLRHQTMCSLCACHSDRRTPGPPHKASPQDKAPHTVADREEADKDGLGVGRTPQGRYQLSEVVQEHKATAHACRVQKRVRCTTCASHSAL